MHRQTGSLLSLSLLYPFSPLSRSLALSLPPSLQGREDPLVKWARMRCVGEREEEMCTGKRGGDAMTTGNNGERERGKFPWKFIVAKVTELSHLTRIQEST